MNGRTLYLQVPTFLESAIRNTLAAVGTVSGGLCNFSNSLQDKLMSRPPVARVHRASVQVVGVELVPIAGAELVSIMCQCRRSNPKELTEP